MNNEIPEKLIRFAESLGGRLVAERKDVAEDDIVVVISAYRPEKIADTIALVFLFDDEEGRECFRDAIFLSYGDSKQFESWQAGEYLRQRAGDYFKGSDSGSGPSGASHMGGHGSRIKRNDR